jgi:hypothetical protein
MPEKLSNVVIRLPVFEDVGIFPRLLIDEALSNRPRASRASRFYVVGLQASRFPWRIFLARMLGSCDGRPVVLANDSTLERGGRA